MSNLFDKPINVSISIPTGAAGTVGGTAGSNCGCPGGAFSPCDPDQQKNAGPGGANSGQGLDNGTKVPNCVAPDPGNGIKSFTTNSISVIALEPMPAFTLVVMSAGGVVKADPTKPEHQNVLLGMTMQEAVASKEVFVLVFGTVLHSPLKGTPGWNFVVNQSVYLGENGVPVQTISGNGFVKQLGFALAHNVVLARPAELPVDKHSTVRPILELPIANTGNTAFVPEAGETYKVAPITADLHLTFKADKLPQHVMSEFKVLFVTDAIPHNVDVAYNSNGVVAAIKAIELNPVDAETNYLVSFLYNGLAQKLSVTSIIKQ